MSATVHAYIIASAVQKINDKFATRLFEEPSSAAAAELTCASNIVLDIPTLLQGR